MKILKKIMLLGLVLGLLLMSAPVMAITENQGNKFSSDLILVKFKAGTNAATKQQLHAKHGASVVREISQLGVQVLRIPAGKVPEKVQSYLLENVIDYAEPDYIATAYGVPNDPSFNSQWGMNPIQAPAAWDSTVGKPEIKIAILDTGVDQNHEDIPAAKIIANKNFTDSSTFDDNYGHGTHVAGIAAAATNNGTGVAGVGYTCSIMNYKVLNDSGSGAYDWISSGIIWAADNGAKVINMSLGGTVGSTTLKNAVDYAWNKGVVIVAAAGNDGVSTASYPAYYSNCIAVAASDSNDAKASFSNYGSWVDVAAPGVGIYSTLPNHSNFISTNYLSGFLNYGSLSGTSMATPFVAGLAGLVWSTTYGTSNTAVRSRIESTADQTGTIWTSYGIERINAYKAVLLSAPPADNTPPETTVISGPANPTSSAAASFTWSGSDSITSTANLVYSYQLDSAGASAFTGNTTANFTGLTDGSHTFKVMAKDEAGNIDLTPAIWTWTVDSTKPVISSLSASTTVNSATISWTTNEQADSRIDYGLKSNNYVSTKSNASFVTSHTMTLSGLSRSKTYYYKVTSKDQAGNLTTTTGSFITKNR